MTARSVTDEQYGRLMRRLGEVARRVDEGTIDFSDTLDLLQHVIEPKLPNIEIVGTYNVDLVAGVSLEQLIQDGSYANWDREIIQGDHFGDFPIEQSRVLPATFIRLDLRASNKRVIQSLRKKGLRPLSGRELLYFGKSHPFYTGSITQQVKLRRPVIALRSSWTGHCRSRKYLELGISNHQRALRLRAEPADGWPTNCLFAGFPAL